LASDEGPRMTDAPKDPQVAEYIEGMRAWRSELEALRPMLPRACIALGGRSPRSHETVLPPKLQLWANDAPRASRETG
jgi:hypothetical protein